MTATTAASSPTSTFSPTASATASPTIPSGGPLCGDGLLEAGEFCIDPTLGMVGDPAGGECAADCVAQACTPGASQAPFRVDLVVPPASMPSSATLFLTYRSSDLQLPGSGLAASVRARVAVPITGATFFPNDRDYALRLVISASAPFSTLSVATVSFDVCGGATLPLSAADLSCFVEGCAGAGGLIDGCTCSVVDPNAAPSATPTPPSDTPTSLPTATSTPTATPTIGVTASATPTATQVPATATPLATTPTPTPTTPPETMAFCGNHLLERGEQCTDSTLGTVGDSAGVACQDDCAAQSCSASGAQTTVTLALELPPAANASSVTVFLAYRNDALAIPGSGLVADVRSRVKALISGATFFPNDRDYALRLVLTSSSVFPSPALATVTFDICSGAGAILDSDFTCFVEGCAGPGAQIEGCGCSARTP